MRRNERSRRTGTPADRADLSPYPAPARTRLPQHAGIGHGRLTRTGDVQHPGPAGRRGIPAGLDGGTGQAWRAADLHPLDRAGTSTPGGPPAGAAAVDRARLVRDTHRGTGGTAGSAHARGLAARLRPGPATAVPADPGTDGRRPSPSRVEQPPCDP